MFMVDIAFKLPMTTIYLGGFFRPPKYLSIGPYLKVLSFVCLPWTPRWTVGVILTAAIFSAWHWYSPASFLDTELITKLSPSSGLHSPTWYTLPSFFHLPNGDGFPFVAWHDKTTDDPTVLQHLMEDQV